MKASKIFKVIVFLALTAVVLTGVVGCGSHEIMLKGDGGKYDKAFPSEYVVEYGESFTVPEAGLPDGTKATVSATDPSGNPYAIQYGVMRPNKAGNYTLTYTAGEATRSVTVRCEDSVAPVISLQTHTENGVIGDVIPLPYYTATDKADIDLTRSGVTVIAPDGTTATVVDGGFELTQRGYYVCEITVYDKNGVSATMEVRTRSALRFVDEDHAEGTIYDFDEADYTELTFDMEGKKALTREIVTEGYPAIEGEGANNGVIAIYDPTSTSATMQDAWTLFRLNERFNMGERNVAGVKIRFAVSTRTDYVHFMRDGYICSRYNEVGGIEPNVWHEMILDPLQWGYFKDLDGFVIKFRDKGQTTLYIDEISFVENEFEDELSAGSLGDFDEAGYLNKVYQNIYCDPTTTNSYCVDGTLFEHLTEGYPEANPEDSTLFPGLGASGGVIKFTTTYYYGGMTYMFPEPVVVDDTSVLTITVYSDDPQPEWWSMGFFNDDGHHLSPTYNWRLGTGVKDNTMVGKQWVKMSFTGEQLRLWTSGDTVTGIFIQARNNRVHNPDVDNDVCTMYIDEITVEERTDAEESDWSFGEVVTEFSTEATLKSVVTPFVNKIGFLPMADVSWVAGDNDGALRIQSNYARFEDYSAGMTAADDAYGDGALVLFDESLVWYDFASMNVRIKAEEGNTISSVSLYAFCPLGDGVLYEVGEIVGTELSTDWTDWTISAEDFMPAVNSLPISGVMIVVSTDGASDMNAVLVDGITLMQ